MSVWRVVCVGGMYECVEGGVCVWVVCVSVWRVVCVA